MKYIKVQIGNAMNFGVERWVDYFDVMAIINKEATNGGRLVCIYNEYAVFEVAESAPVDEDGWFDVKENLPERNKGKKTIVQGWDGKCQYTLQYVFPKTETIDTEDFQDDFNWDESDYDSDEKAGETYLKEGFWEECENSGYHDYMWYKRKITHWHYLLQPPNSNNATQ